MFTGGAFDEKLRDAIQAGVLELQLWRARKVARTDETGNIHVQPDFAADNPAMSLRKVARKAIWGAFQADSKHCMDGSGERTLANELRAKDWYAWREILNSEAPDTEAPDGETPDERRARWLAALPATVAKWAACPTQNREKSTKNFAAHHAKRRADFWAKMLLWGNAVLQGQDCEAAALAAGFNVSGKTSATNHIARTLKGIGANVARRVPPTTRPSKPATGKTVKA